MIRAEQAKIPSQRSGEQQRQDQENGSKQLIFLFIH
jgi:hypothetical protein